MTTVHTYMRSANKIFVGDAADQWRELHSFETEQRAKRWQRDQEKKRPGSVTVGHPPLRKLPQKDVGREVLAALARKKEIARLTREQAADMKHSPSPKPIPQTLSGKTAQLAQAYVAPDRDGSSFLRERSKKRQQSRSARNTRATFGGS